MINTAPIQYRTYTKHLHEWVKEHKRFTHRDIILLTGCNCSYRVLAYLRTKCKILEEWVKDAEKPHKVYFYDGELEK